MNGKDMVVSASKGSAFDDLGLPRERRAKENKVLTIKSRIENLKLHQAKAAERMGIKQSELQNILRGDFSDYSVKCLTRLLTALEYINYKELASSQNEGTDYKITLDDHDNDVCIVAPHAGEIEPVTSEIAKAIAKDNYNLYLFEGCLRKDNSRLHITSHKFDEPNALALVKKSQITLGVHGRKDRSDKDTIYLGGLDSEFVSFIATRLEAARVSSQIGGHSFPACSPNNICNRGNSGTGAQIEVPKTLRDKLRQDAKLLDRFAGAIRSSIEDKLNAQRKL